MTAPPSRPEGRSLFRPQSASELGAPVASSMPEQLPGHEPASARKGYEDGNALVWRYRRVEGSLGRHALARGGMRFGVQCRRLDQLVEQLRGFSFGEIGLEASGGYETGVMRALLAPACPSA